MGLGRQGEATVVVHLSGNKKFEVFGNEKNVFFDNSLSMSNRSFKHVHRRAKEEAKVPPVLLPVRFLSNFRSCDLFSDKFRIVIFDNFDFLSN